MNHVNKDGNDLVYVIITLITSIIGGYKVFYDGVKQTDLGKRAHVLKYLHDRIIMGTFEIFFHEGSLWRGHISVISFIISKQIFVNLIRHGDQFHNQYLN